MFKRLRAAIRIIGQQYPAISQTIVYTNYQESIQSTSDIFLYGNVQNIHDGANISLGANQADIRHEIVFLCNDYISLGNPVYNGTTTRVFIIYLGKYYRLTNIGDVQYGYHRYHGKLVNLLVGLPSGEKNDSPS